MKKSILMFMLTLVLLVVSTLSVHAAYNEQQKIYTMNTNIEVLQSIKYKFSIRNFYPIVV